MKTVYNPFTRKLDFVNESTSEASKDLGMYKTLILLQAAHPTPADGSWARVSATDTIYAYKAGTGWYDTNLKPEAGNVSYREYENLSADVEAPAGTKARVYVRNGLLSIRTADGIKFANTIEPSVIRRDETAASPAWQIVNNLAMFELIKKGFFGATINDDGTIKKRLSDHYALIADDGTGINGLDNIMIVSPGNLYMKEWFDGNYRYISLSLLPAAGHIKYPQFGIGKFKASIDANGKICSIKDVYPTTNKNIIEFEAAAQLRGANWHVVPHEYYRIILNMYLFEFLTNDAQTALGVVSRASSTDWSNYNGYNPVNQTGYMIDKPTTWTGKKDFTISNFVNGNAPLNSEMVQFMGIENWYGEIWEWLINASVLYDETFIKVYKSDSAPYTFNTAANKTEILMQLKPGSGYVKELSGLTLFPKQTGGGSSTYYCDNHYEGSVGWRVPAVGGYFHSSLASGPFYLSCSYSSGSRNPNFGARAFCLIDGGDGTQNI